MFHKPKKKTKIMESHTRTHTHTHTHTHTYNSRKLSEIKENLNQGVKGYIQNIPRKTVPLVNSN